MRTRDEALRIYNSLYTLLDCTNPPEDLARALGFHSRTHSGVYVKLCLDRQGTYYFYFELSIPCDLSAEVGIYADDTIFDKYLT